MKKQETFEDAIPKPQTIWFKLWMAKQEIGAVTKGNDNPFFKSKYADLNSLLDACEPILSKYNLILLQPIKNGCICTEIIDIENGDSVSSELQLPNIVDPQKMIAACTYYRRATLQSLLVMKAVDDDGNTASEGSKRVLSNERFNQALKSCVNGQFDPEKLKLDFDLTDDQLMQLNEIL